MPSFGYSAFAPIMCHHSREDDKSKTRTGDIKTTSGTKCTRDTRDTKTCLTMPGGYKIFV